MLIAWSWYSIVQLKDGIISGFFFRKESESGSFLSGERLTGAFEVLLLGLPPHHGAARTRGIHVPGQSAHVEGRQAVGRHGAGRERVAESCRDMETPIIGFLFLVYLIKTKPKTKERTRTRVVCMAVVGSGAWLVGVVGVVVVGREDGGGASSFPGKGAGTTLHLDCTCTRAQPCTRRRKERLKQRDRTRVKGQTSGSVSTLRTFHF